MFQGDNFISFHDLSPDAVFLWISPSLVDCLGFEPEEVIGMEGYKLLHDDDVQPTKDTHLEHMFNDLVASQVVVRYKTKDGGVMPAVCVFSVCYDYIVNCSTMIKSTDPNSEKAINAPSLHCNSPKEFDRIKQHHAAFMANTWDPRVLQPEVRVCLILNRFTRNLIIMYASSSAQLLFNIDSEDMVGRPLLLYIRSDDLATFVEQVDMVKATNVITHMRFWFQSPSYAQEIPCESMLFGSSDGMVIIIRRCRPFVRKRLIGLFPDGTLTSSQQPHMSKYMSSTSSASDSASDSLSSSPPVSEHPHFRSMEYKRPIPAVRTIPIGSISEIMELDPFQDRIRPLHTIIPDQPMPDHNTVVRRIVELDDEDTMQESGA
ncbi:hypothetical protein BGW38_006408 [Lunasporangiospora selenospora]|uniref:PAS domain-containing protein n=1 Tax=Lunasporangiospora selenospora TaxID=979761 RepID=A0A9P6FLW0_9FUNG|nr:hypothetical protein BGW38_006408 [Lunasporangiospora selenospora]